MSFYEEKNPADISIEEILPSIKNYLPEINDKSIRFFYHGTYNVFDIKNEYILRVADREFRNNIGLEMIRRESRLLNFLQKKFDLSLPEILFIHESEKIPFSIHKKIPGKSLVFVIQNLSNSQKKSIGAKIGQFLSILHSEELKLDIKKHFLEQQEFSITDKEFINSFRSFWISRYKEAKEIAFNYLNKKEKVWLTKIFENYLNEPNNFSFSPRTTHCDFDTSNILIDTTSNQLTGIIDFEDCKIWDPAADLLFFDDGPIFMKEILDNYEFTDQKSLLDRMKFFYCRTCVPYLVWGTLHNRPGMVEEGIRKIKKNMRLFPIE
ncbi:MAG: aminoglycoside phosphotransferase family protein [Candidatus Heimdallarchaeota archaeon]|nr:aminoglycoside phosphotransferase family protein [Candidatus Heimdallarchaeota archaeon]